jgi:hypothetical protein
MSVCRTGGTACERRPNHNPAEDAALCDEQMAGGDLCRQKKAFSKVAGDGKTALYLCSQKNNPSHEASALFVSTSGLLSEAEGDL